MILFSILGPIKQLSNVNIRIQAGAASAERIFNLLDIKPQIVEKENPIGIESFKSEIRFENVNFEYFEGDGPVLENVSFSIKKGEVVALVGPSGSGKSTIADLIPRFYDVSSGNITLDNINIKDASLASLRNNLGIVSQEVVLLSLIHI